MKKLLLIMALMISAQAAFAEEVTKSTQGGEIRPDCNAVVDASTILPQAPVSTSTPAPKSSQGRSAQ
jgi:hypothetical protein